VYEHVLAVTDGSREADRAVEAASELAFEHRARLTVATAVELEPPGLRCGPAPGVWNDVLRDAAKADLDRAGQLVRVPADYQIFYGSPIEAIADGARTLGCDVIVVPPRARRLGRVLHKHRWSALARRVDCGVIEPDPDTAADPSATLGHA
jgi:nucleotide-binding universal stress UspA family protein